MNSFIRETIIVEVKTTDLRFVLLMPFLIWMKILNVKWK